MSFVEANLRDEQDRDPLWEAAFWLVFVDALGFLFFHAFTARPLFDAWDTLFFLPLMALGLARGIRNNGGNVTGHVRDILRGRATANPRYTPGFAAYMTFLYAVCTVSILDRLGVSAGTLAVIAAQGMLTAYFVARVVVAWRRRVI